ncbi:MAG: RseA family anti-sigma factor [Anaerobiospirillum sp.]|nr:RseA family anti-sigma factor [Anaerobiospirillum sp.]
MQHLSSKKYEHLMHASEVFDGQNYQNPEALEALRGSDEVSADEMHRHLKHWSLIGAALRHELPERIDLNFSDKVMAQLDAESAWVPPAESAWVPPIESTRDSDLPSMLQGKWSNPGPLSANSEQKVAHEYAALVTNLKAQRATTDFNAQHVAADFDQATLNTVPHQPNKRHPVLTFKLVGSWLGQAAVAASVAVVAVVGVQLYNASQPELNNPVATSAVTQVGPVNGLNLASYQNSDNDLIMNPELMPQQPQVNTPESQNKDLTDAEVRAEQKAELDRINLYVQGYMLETAAN